MAGLEVDANQAIDNPPLDPPLKKAKMDMDNNTKCKVETDANSNISSHDESFEEVDSYPPTNNAVDIENVPECSKEGTKDLVRFDSNNVAENFLNSDSNYFSCYADLSIHRVMIGDHTRTQTYRKAILSNYKLFHRKVVLDVGAGTGILSLFCAQAGAKRVYAIEASAIAEQAQKVVNSNGFADRIIVMQQKVEEVELPEKIDIIVSEWMGYMLMYESMLPSLLYARDTWLKKDGFLFPEEVKIFIAPISDYQEYEYSVRFWKKVSDTYGVDMSALAKPAEEQMQASVHVMSVDPASIQSHAGCIASIRLSKVDAKVTECTEGSFSCSCFGHATIHGFVIWFTVHFPNNVMFSTSPYERETHWEQSVLYIPPVHVRQNTKINGHIWIRRDLIYHRFLDIELEYEVDHLEKKKMRYKMKD